VKTLTQSAISKLWECPRAYYWRYVRQLVPERWDTEALDLGSLVHAALEAYYLGADADAVLAVIDKREPDHLWAKARAMVAGYMATYRADSYDCEDVESVVNMPIRNPATGCRSRSFQFRGKVDILTTDGVVVDHKTAGTIGPDMLEKLWTDVQLSAYCVASGVTEAEYDILGKPSIKPFRKSTRPRKVKKDGTPAADPSWHAEDETPEAYHQRCLDWLYAHPEAYHRERVIIAEWRRRQVHADLWNATQDILRYHRTDWPQHWTSCHKWGGRPCAYAPICQSDGNPFVIENDYRHEVAHVELTEETAAPAPF
jgi:hypothetical protein